MLAPTAGFPHLRFKRGFFSNQSLSLLDLFVRCQEGALPHRLVDKVRRCSPSLFESQLTYHHEDVLLHTLHGLRFTFEDLPMGF